MKKIGPEKQTAGEKGALAAAVRQLRALARQGASVTWGNRRWFVGWYGLTPTDREWGDLSYHELGAKAAGEIVRRVRAERAKPRNERR